MKAATQTNKILNSCLSWKKSPLIVELIPKCYNQEAKSALKVWSQNIFIIFSMSGVMSRLSYFSFIASATDYFE